MKDSAFSMFASIWDSLKVCFGVERSGNEKEEEKTLEEENITGVVVFLCGSIGTRRV
ncbi:hypothetical protein SESBI_03585 [Sesbania bispinosa]|nr:hypothetical protein SESBI_03585 [Sesbania bispinosa]